MRHDLEVIFKSALAAVAPDQALLSHLKLDGDILKAGDREYDLAKGKVFVVGGGKGTAPMAQALENLLEDYIEKGHIVVKYDHDLPLRRIGQSQAAHPVPDESGRQGAQAILDLASSMTANDLLICLITGGASALLPLPAAGLTLEELREATSQLLASGASIDELNAIRKHLSSFSGGQLARAVNGKVLSVIVSDVIGDDLATIASGPTAPDPYTYGDCLEIISKYGLEDKFPKKALEILRQGAAGKIAETPKPDDKIFARVQNIIVASNHQALEAAAKTASSLGYDVELLPGQLEGEARDRARELIDLAKTRQQAMKNGAKPLCILGGGETTVKIRGGGLGGRNQEMALAATIELENAPGIEALFAGTDGTDGPTDAAGGFASAEGFAKFANSAEAKKFLDNNDSYHGLEKTGELLITGPTRTNVMDIAIILVSKI